MMNIDLCIDSCSYLSIGNVSRINKITEFVYRVWDILVGSSWANFGPVTFPFSGRFCVRLTFHIARIKNPFLILKWSQL